MTPPDSTADATRRAIVFDCDGVLADTERHGHLPAFNQMFAELGLPVRWSEEEYGELLRIGGGKERMASLLTPLFVSANGLPDDPTAQAEEIARWHARKTEIYVERLLDPGIPARPGVARIVEEAAASGWALAMATTTAEVSARAVLEHVVGKERADDFLVLAGDIVERKKPAPDVYLLAVERLGIPASQIVVVDDSNIGLQAARDAQLACLVTVSDYTVDQDFSTAQMVVTSLGDPSGPRAEVLANRSAARPRGWVTIDDLAALLLGG